MHHEKDVEFDEEPPAGEQVCNQGPSVTLEITIPDKDEHQLWDFYAVTPLQVTVSIPMKATSILKAYTVRVFP